MSQQGAEVVHGRAPGYPGAGLGEGDVQVPRHIGAADLGQTTKGVAVSELTQVPPVRGTRRMVRLPGVYRPQADSHFLASALRDMSVVEGSQVLDLCTGTGVLALCAARLGARVTAVDISRRAVLSARLNARLARVPVAVHRGDLFSAVPSGRSFDLVMSNPPYVPSPAPAAASRGGRGWDAGPEGRELAERICERAPAMLSPGGRLLLVLSGICAPRHTVSQLRSIGMEASIIHRVRVPLGPVLRERSAWLSERGLLAEHAETEELVIVSGRKA